MSLKDNFNQAIREVLRKELVDDDPPKTPKRKADSDILSSPVLSGEDSLAPDRYAADPSSSAGGYREPVPPREAPPTEMPARDSDPFGDFDDGAGSADITGGGYSADTRPSGAAAPPPLYDYSQPAPSAGYADPYRNSGVSSRGAAMSGFTGRQSSYVPPMGGGFRGGRPPENSYYETEETTIISRNTRISGDISSFANVNVEGSVQGDIKLTKNIAVSGKVVGNIECNNAVMAGAQMQGSISSKGQVQMDHDSVLLGDIDTQYLDLNGRIKGNVAVGGKAEFKNDAVIVGDITASTISVIDGAVIKGYVNTTFMQESTSNIFPEAISVGEA